MLILLSSMKYFRAKMVCSVTETATVGVNHWKEGCYVKRNTEVWSIQCDFQSPFLPTVYLQTDYQILLLYKISMCVYIYVCVCVFNIYHSNETSVSPHCSPLLFILDPQKERGNGELAWYSLDHVSELGHCPYCLPQIQTRITSVIQGEYIPEICCTWLWPQLTITESAFETFDKRVALMFMFLPQ